MEAPTARPPNPTTAALWALLALGYVVLAWPTLRLWAVDCWSDPDLSHVFVVPLISGAILWSMRDRLRSADERAAWQGSFVMVGALAVFFAGRAALASSVERVGVWLLGIGLVWFCLGRRVVTSAFFALFFLLFAVPPPFVVVSVSRVFLKQLAIRMSSDVLSLCGFESRPLGSVLVVEGHQLEVADACTGIRSLFAIVTTAVLFAYLLRLGLIRGVFLAAIAVPVTVVLNVARILIVAIALAAFGVDLTGGSVHAALGAGVFLLSLVFLYVSCRVLEWLIPDRQVRPAGEPSSVADASSSSRASP